MQRNKQILDHRILIRALPLLTVFTSLCATSQTIGKVRFDYVMAVNNKDSQFTNTADINGDGKPDILAFKGGGGGFISWYEYPGFRQHIIRNGNFNAGRPFAADLDRDGDMDVVVAKKSNRHVYWYENPLPGSNPIESNWIEHHVGSTKNINKGDYIKDYGVADFDRDGFKDIVVCTFTDPAEIFIYFQKNKSTWYKKTHTYTNGHEGLDIGDVDDDGDPDVVTNGRWFETPVNPRDNNLIEHVIDKKWHNQRGGWQRNATMIRVADIDGNGKLDVVISHSEKENYPISWYSAENPKGKWIEHHIDPDYGWCQTLDVGDVDLDGDLDLLAGRFTRPNPPDVPLPHDIRIYYNRGDGLDSWYKQAVREKGGIYFGHFTDMDADGDLDIVGPRTYWEGPIELWENKLSKTEYGLDKFTYIQIDDARDKRYFGLVLRDLTGDGYIDITAGKWFYRNPGGDMIEKWERVVIDGNVDALVALDVDNDELGDLIALRPNEQYWYEAKDPGGRSWTKVNIGSLPINDHRISTQYYALGQLVPGGRPEVILAEYYLTVPENPLTEDWPAVKYATEGKGYAVGDIDTDGLLDIVGSYSNKSKGEIVLGTRSTKWWSSRICWWKNPGDDSGDWRRFDIGTATHADRFAIADINGDKRLDVVVTEERYPGHVPNAHCYWYEQPAELRVQTWKRNIVVKQFSMNNLDVADMDRDGDPDIITCEHSMPFADKSAPGKERLQIWENDGKGNFKEQKIDKGKESHLGAQVADLDGDGDLDIVSIAWRDYQYLHLWRNDN